ncbi:hypothetical protein DLAC_01265 [Tieghemostelium lacteum]|uniref:Uncharacterized protein n=1 Tax=Tieghemostelium lacteum TaxID=361077 RepID=A0A152A8K8_TIELA|nr:hypothetical protein DLAC_01265 [Tieghemostelium lacteum]|eukprot:KYR02425.1 hypothetical protein DLAC_01265 [Tieghemostelium lacteum]
MISDYLVKLILEYLININYVQFLKAYTLVCKHWTYKLISTLTIEQCIEIIPFTPDFEITSKLNLLKKYGPKYLLYNNRSQSILKDFINSNFGVHIKSISTNELLVDSLMNTQLYPNLSKVFITHTRKIPITFLETFKISQYSDTIDFQLDYSGSHDSGSIVFDINDFIQFSDISLFNCTIEFKISKISSKNRIKRLALCSVGMDIPQLKLLLNQSPLLEELELDFNFNAEQYTLLFRDMFIATIPWTLKVLYINEPIMFESVLVYILENVKSELVEIYLDEVAPDTHVETIKLSSSIKKLIFRADYNIHDYIDNYENLESLNSNSKIFTKPLKSKLKKLKCIPDYLWTNLKHFSETLTSLTVSDTLGTFSIENVITLLNIRTLDRIHVSYFTIQANLVTNAFVDSLKSNTNLTYFILDSYYLVSDYSHLNTIINILQTNHTLKVLGLPKDYEQLPKDLTLINKQLCELFTKNKTIMKTSLYSNMALHPILDQFFIGNYH